MKMKLIVYFILLLTFLPISLYSQRVFREFSEITIDSISIQELRTEYGRNKNIPGIIENQVLWTLSFYPELKNIKIEFRFRRSKSALLAKPTLMTAFFRQAKKRKYIIVISKQPCTYLEHVQFFRLPLNAQVGVLGHELAHISDFTQRNFWGFWQIALGNLSGRWLDKYEFNTDRAAIDHGLGYQLLAWSKAVRDTLHIRKYLGGYNVKEEQIKLFQESERERYMNPETIVAIIEKHPLYKANDKKYEKLVE